MAPPSWATKEQLDFLHERYATFLDHQKRGKLVKFWSILEYQWFDSYPERASLFGNMEELTAEQDKELNEAIKCRKAVGARRFCLKLKLILDPSRSKDGFGTRCRSKGVGEERCRICSILMK